MNLYISVLSCLSTIIMVESKFNIPIGFYDETGDAARMREAMIRLMIDLMKSYSYRRVNPSVIESLDLKNAREKFIFTDAMTGNQVALRSDITPQIKRLAGDLLVEEPRPLRVFYSGEVFKSKISIENDTRKLTQIGAEIIGIKTHNAIIESIILALKCLAQVGEKNLVLALHVPNLAEKISGDAHVQEKIRNRDESLSDEIKKIFKMSEPDDSELFAGQREFFEALKNKIAAEDIDVKINYDPASGRADSYHDFCEFEILSADTKTQLARGGRYLANDEAASGFSIYLERLNANLEIEEIKTKKIFEDKDL